VDDPSALADAGKSGKRCRPAPRFGRSGRGACIAVVRRPGIPGTTGTFAGKAGLASRACGLKVVVETVGRERLACQSNVRAAMAKGNRRMNASGAGKVIQIASSHKMGLTAQETELAIAYRKLNYFNFWLLPGKTNNSKAALQSCLITKLKTLLLTGF
jgi:hypothetical protein